MYTLSRIVMEYERKPYYNTINILNGKSEHGDNVFFNMIECAGIFYVFFLLNV